MKALLLDIFRRMDNIADKWKYIYYGSVAVVILASLIILNALGPNLTLTKLDNASEDGITYLKQAHDLREQYAANKISKDEFNRQGGEIENKVRKINDLLHAEKIASEIEIDKSILENTGDALEGLVAVLFNTENLYNLNDEVLALSIILEDIKDGQLQT